MDGQQTHASGTGRAGRTGRPTEPGAGGASGPAGTSPAASAAPSSPSWLLARGSSPGGEGKRESQRSSSSLCHGAQGHGEPSPSPCQSPACKETEGQPGTPTRRSAVCQGPLPALGPFLSGERGQMGPELLWGGGPGGTAAQSRDGQGKPPTREDPQALWREEGCPGTRRCRGGRRTEAAPPPAAGLLASAAPFLAF